MIKAKYFNENYFYPEECEQNAQSFFNSYTLETEVNCPAKKPYFPKVNRVCRFCSKSAPDVSFNNDAHVISELLGNHHLVSDFECDKCNEVFGKYESDLANFLGITRTFQSVKGKKNKIPKFPSYDKKLKVESKFKPQIGQVVCLRRLDGLNKTFQFDKENNRTIITYVKNPFIPLNVFKAFLKMALTIIDPKYLKNYDFALEYLRSKNHDDINGFQNVLQYTLPLTFQFSKPVGMIFKKKLLEEDLLTHVFVLFALNSIYQIILPFNRSDIEIYKKVEKGEKMFIKWCPPIFDSDLTFSSDYIFSTLIKLNINEVIKNETEQIIMPGGPETITFESNETGEFTEEIFDGGKVEEIQILKVENPKL